MRVEEKAGFEAAAGCQVWESDRGSGKERSKRTADFPGVFLPISDVVECMINWEACLVIPSFSLSRRVLYFRRSSHLYFFLRHRKRRKEGEQEGTPAAQPPLLPPCFHLLRPPYPRQCPREVEEAEGVRAASRVRSPNSNRWRNTRHCYRNARKPGKNMKERR